MMDVAARVQCSSAEDIAIKLALWRREATEFDLASMSRADQVLYSAYRDAVRLSGREDLLTQDDREFDNR